MNGSRRVRPDRVAVVSARPPRVTLVTRIFEPEPAAASFRLTALVRALRRRGAGVRVLTVRPPRDSAAVSDPPGVTVRRAPVLRDRTGYVRGYLPYLSFDLPVAIRMLLDPAPDVYVCEPPPTTGVVVRLVAALRRRPYVYYAADIWGDATAGMGASGAVVGVVRAMELWALRGAARVIAISEAVAQRLDDLGVERVSVVRNGVDTDVFRPDGPRPETGGGSEGLPRAAVSPSAEPASPASVSPGPGAESDGRVVRHEPYLLYAGTASEWQGSDVFLRAMPRVLAEIPRARVVMIGQGSAWPLLAELAAALPPGAVELRAPVPAGEIARWQRGARAALASVRPGAGYDLAYPTKTYAAWASGTPVVYAGPGAAREDIEAHGLGWAVPYDAEAVALAMIEALRGAGDGFEPDRLAAWARQHVSAVAAGDRAARVVLDVAGSRPRA